MLPPQPEIVAFLELMVNPDPLNQGFVAAQENRRGFYKSDQTEAQLIKAIVSQLQPVGEDEVLHACCSLCTPAALVASGGLLKAIKKNGEMLKSLFPALKKHLRAHHRLEACSRCDFILIGVESQHAIQHHCDLSKQVGLPKKRRAEAPTAPVVPAFTCPIEMQIHFAQAKIQRGHVYEAENQRFSRHLEGLGLREAKTREQTETGFAELLNAMTAKITKPSAPAPLNTSAEPSTTEESVGERAESSPAAAAAEEEEDLDLTQSDMTQSNMTQSSLSGSAADHQKSDSPSSLCQHCFKTFLTRSPGTLMLHAFRCVGFQPYSCSGCAKPGDRMQQLQAHVKRCKVNLHIGKPKITISLELAAAAYEAEAALSRCFPEALFPGFSAL